jgi:hypothetical protein
VNGCESNRVFNNVALRRKVRQKGNFEPWQHLLKKSFFSVDWAGELEVCTHRQVTSTFPNVETFEIEYWRLFSAG